MYEERAISRGREISNSEQFSRWKVSWANSAIYGYPVRKYSGRRRVDRFFSAVCLPLVIGKRHRGIRRLALRLSSKSVRVS